MTDTPPTSPASPPMPQWALMALMMFGGSATVGGGTSFLSNFAGESAIEESIEELAEDIQAIERKLGERDTGHELDHLWICAKRLMPQCAGLTVVAPVPPGD